MNSSHTVADWINLLALGALLGASGQMVRQVSGVKKLLVEKPGIELGALLDTSRVVMMLLIGAVAGMLSALAIDWPTPPSLVTTQTLLALVAAGYTGADFVESFFPRPAQPKRAAEVDA